MKRILVFLAVCAVALCATSCFNEGPALTLTPESVTIKVGQSVQLHPGTIGDGIDFADVIRIMTDDNVCYFDNTYNVTGLNAGTTRVGIGVLNDKEDESKGLKYSAYTTVRVVE